MPKFIGKKWYLEDGDPLVVDTADGVVTNGGVAFRVVGVDDAEIFYYDEELGEQFTLSYDKEPGPNYGRLYINNRTLYEESRKEVDS